jgi:peptidoglycan/xylan/chitin deacetylase (PgdA/CDA1 family)
MKIPIVSYHSINNENCPISLNLEEFEKQLVFFKKNNFQSIHCNEIKNTSKKKFIITFDDGYKDLITNALPLLKKYNFKATCLIISNLIGKRNIWDEFNENIKDKELMNLSDINYWLKNGMRIGSHSKNHKKLTKLDDKEKIDEIINSKNELESLTGTTIDSFCYPYGLYNENVVNIVKEKYDFAFTTNRSRFNTNKHNKYLLPRIDMGKKISKFKLYLKAFTPYEDILSN